MKSMTTILQTSLLVILFSCCPRSHGQNLTPIIDLNEEQTSWKGRISSVSTTSPVATYFRNNPKADKAISKVFDYIERVWSLVDTRRRNNDSQACNLYSTVPKDWVSQMKTRVKTFQIGIVDDSCLSKVDLRTAISDNELPSSIVYNLRDLFAESRRLTSQAFHELKIVPDGNWSADGKAYDFSIRKMIRSGQTCTVDDVFAHHRNGVWYLRAGVTNAPIRQSMPDFERHYLQEFFPRNGTSSLKMIQPNIRTGKWEYSTTIVERWGGTGMTIEQPMRFDDPISPLAHAFQRNLVTIDLASDAITVSNVAILALPMAMNFIPVAFVADFHMLGMFIYVVVTDVFSTIPFLIKGIELIRSSQPTQEEVFAFFTGNETLGTMQSWVAECRGEEAFREVGVIFVSVGLCALIVGVALEVWAKRYMYWKRSQAKDSWTVNGPFGRVALDYERDVSVRRMSHYEDGRDAYRQETEQDANAQRQTKRRRLFVWSRSD